MVRDQSKSRDSARRRNLRPRRKIMAHTVASSSESPGDTSQPPQKIPKVHHRHDMFTSQPDRGSGRHSTVVTLEGSPKKSNPKAFYLVPEDQPLFEGTTFDGANIWEFEMGEEDQECLDPNYVYQVEASDVRERGKGRVREPQVPAMHTWLPAQDSFLDVLLRMEGRGRQSHGFLNTHAERVDLRDAPSGEDNIQGTNRQAHLTDAFVCPLCENEGFPAVYRCLNCYAGEGGELMSLRCVLALHERNPLHRIQVWQPEGQYFDPCTLKALGLRVQLGHSNRKCPNPRAGPEDFIVISTTGIHSVAVDFCACDRMLPHYHQLLLSRWFPATVKNPKTVAVFDTLDTFQLHSFESKTSAYDYYNALARLTDNTGLSKPADRYETFMRMIRQWRNLAMLKRAARGHDPAGSAHTQEGECAVRCPACPQPGKNLPDGWQRAPMNKRWLYNLILAMDANFRLKRKWASSDKVDPGLGVGWAYFVEEIAFKKHVKEYTHQTEMSTCSGLSAVEHVETKDNRGLAATGVGCVVCARHQCIRPRGVCDLQKGERYCNMDYIFFSTLRSEELAWLTASYDIVCQWERNLWKRMADMPADFQLDLTDVVFHTVIPKFHLPGHHLPCHVPYSFNLMPGVGRTDGEGIERDWAVTNPLGTSTKEMGPGSRRDTLDDHWGDWNWKKVVGMGTSLYKKLKYAIPERKTHKIQFQRFSASLSPVRVQEWTDMVEAWNLDRSCPNPYAITVKKMTQADIREALAREDAEATSKGALRLHDTSPASWLITGLEIEDAQRTLRGHIACATFSTATQRARLQERRNVLQSRIDAWKRIQGAYMPVVASIELGLSEDFSGRQPEESDLWLPSQLPDDVRDSSPGWIKELTEMEWRLRYGQAHDALTELRYVLHLLAHQFKFKDRQTCGVSSNTRARASIDRAEQRKRAAMEKYRRARAALMSLDPDRDGWQTELRELTDRDARGMADGLGDQAYGRHADKKKSKKTRRKDGEHVPAAGSGVQGGKAADALREGEGHRLVSWIWMAAGAARQADEDDPEYGEALRVEWAKSKARAARWDEEVTLVLEEMRRVEQYLVWRHGWWLERRHQRDEHIADSALLEGLHAYASRQAQLQLDIRDRFATLWQGIRSEAEEALRMGDDLLGGGEDADIEEDAR